MPTVEWCSICCRKWTRSIASWATTSIGSTSSCPVWRRCSWGRVGRGIPRRYCCRSLAGGTRRSRGTPEELAAFSAEWDQPEPMKRGNGEIGWHYAESKRARNQTRRRKLTFHLTGLRPGKLRIFPASIGRQADQSRLQPAGAERRRRVVRGRADRIARRPCDHEPRQPAQGLLGACFAERDFARHCAGTGQGGLSDRRCRPREVVSPKIRGAEQSFAVPRRASLRNSGWTSTWAISRASDCGGTGVELFGGSEGTCERGIRRTHRAGRVVGTYDPALSWAVAGQPSMSSPSSTSNRGRPAA